uniref:Uncharacterized protein n=1 Tax=uncultured prokaryote TaxID=198431 RepID=A0A0H5QEM9_9ZZZZ|nr:hypothetical protein [uncultured prokaryote]
MKAEYITIKEASKLAEKHADTIRNLARNNPKATTKDSKGRVLIDKSLVIESYSVQEIATEQAIAPPEATGANTTEQVMHESTQGAGVAHTASDKLIDSLVAELEAKNQIINQQQQTIQQIVNQQQQLTGMLMNRNQGADNMLAGGDNDSMDIYGKYTEKNGENAAESTSVNPIEGKAIKEKVIKGKGFNKKKDKKKHWWSR